MAEPEKSANAPKKTKTPAAGMSRLFVLRSMEAEFEDVKDKEVGQSGLHKLWELKRVPKPITNRWLYIFQYYTGTATWVAEHRLDEQGNIHPVDMKQAKDKERDKRPDWAKDAYTHGNRMTLPTDSNGFPIQYCFLGSGSRLPLAAIQKLLSNNYSGELPWFDLKDDNSFGSEKQPEGQVNTSEDGAYVGVLDLMKFCMSLNRVVQKLRNREIGWAVPAQGLSDEQRKRTEIRQKKKLLSTTIRALADNDSGNLNIRKYLKREDMGNWVKDYETMTKYKRADVNSAAEMLANLMRSKLMLLLVEANLSIVTVDPLHLDDLALFFKEYSLCIDRLVETDTGMNWLTEIVSDKSHFIHTWMMDTSAAPAQYAQVFGKAPEAFYWIFKEVFIPYRAKYGLAFKKSMVIPMYGTVVPDGQGVDLEAIYFTNKTGHNVVVSRDADVRIVYDTPPPDPHHVTVGDPSVDPDAPTMPGTPRNPNPRDVIGNPSVDPNAPTVQEHPNTDPSVTQRTQPPPPPPRAPVEPPPPPHHLEYDHLIITTKRTPTNWSKYIPDGAVAAIQKAMDEFLKVVNVLNLGLALYSLSDNGYDPWHLLNAAAAAGHTITAFNVVLNLSKESVQRIGMIAAVIDAVTATHNAVGAQDKGDTTAAVGYVIVGAGSALTAIGMGLAIVGVETSWTGVGLVMAAVGFLVVLLGGKSDLQRFADHCLWGTSYREDGGDDKWQDAPFRNWDEDKPGGLDHQIKAMFNLLSAFSLDNALLEGGFKSVRVSVGMMMPTSKLYVRFKIPYGKDGKNLHQPTIIYNMLTRELEQDQTGDRADLKNKNALAVIVSKSGQLQAIEIAGLYDPEDYQNMGFEQSADCEVRLDLFGDGKRWIPSSGDWVPYHIWSQNQTISDLGHHVKSSVDY